MGEEKYLEAEYDIFMFVNSGSGSGVGTQLLELESPKRFDLKVPENDKEHGLSKEVVPVDLHIYSMRKTKDEGFQLLKKYTKQSQRKCLGVICGGDGTVTWVIGEMHKHQIASRKVPFSIIPLGTGNDFSQSLGWGNTSDGLVDDDCRRLQKFLVRSIVARDEDMDVWQVTTTIQEYGKIQQFKDGEHKLIGDTVSKPFINYFSFGLDGKVGYSFDMHRTQSRIGNLAVYGGLGLVKGFTKTKNLNELLVGFNEDIPPVQGKIDFSPEAITKSIFASAMKGSKSKVLYEYNENILALNINSYMGGAKDIWKNSIDNPKTEAAVQDSSDGKLEFVSFPGSVSIGLEKTIGGFAHRVCQGTGPFKFEFKQYDKELKHRTYLQIDGEFYRVTHPKEVRIQKSPLLNGKFRVLRRKEPKKPKDIGCCGCFG